METLEKRKQENYKVKTCKNYRINKDKKYVPDKTGKIFIHSSKHRLDNVNSQEKKIDRDVSASIVLSYGHREKNRM